MSLLFNKADKKKKEKEGQLPKGLTMLKKSSRTIMHCSRLTGKMGETWEHRWVMNLQFHEGMTAFHCWISSQIQSLLRFSWWLLFPLDHHHQQQAAAVGNSGRVGSHFLLTTFPEMSQPSTQSFFWGITKLTPRAFIGLGLGFRVPGWWQKKVLCLLPEMESWCYSLASTFFAEWAAAHQNNSCCCPLCCCPWPLQRNTQEFTIFGVWFVHLIKSVQNNTRIHHTWGLIPSSHQICAKQHKIENFT